jgi:hypothetical protein
LESFDQLTVTLFAECSTVDDLFRRAVQLYARDQCLGSRQVLSEKEEKQPNGKVFKKVSKQQGLEMGWWGVGVCTIICHTIKVGLVAQKRF